jgi:hypothetical protein
MSLTRSGIQNSSAYMCAVILGGILLIPIHSPAEETSPGRITGTGNKNGDTQPTKGNRSTVGIVEEITEHTIRVNSGDAGDISPRYLNLQNNVGNEEIKLGDTLQIEVNAQNEVVRYQKIIGSTEKKP